MLDIRIKLRIIEIMEKKKHFSFFFFKIVKLNLVKFSLTYYYLQLYHVLHI